MVRQIRAREEFLRGQPHAQPQDPGAGGLEVSAAPFARPRRRSSSPSEVHPAGRPPPHRSCSSSAPPLFVQARPLLVHDSRATGPARYRLTAAVLLVLDWNPSPPATPSPQGELPSLPCSSPLPCRQLLPCSSPLYD